MSSIIELIFANQANSLAVRLIGENKRLRTGNDLKNRSKKMLKHCNLWAEPKARDAPGIVQEGDVDFILDSQYIPMDEFLANF